jgi:hypothetical protein
MSSVNLLKNGIGIDQAQALASMLKDHPTLKSLCGNKGNEVELDMHGKMNGAADAIMLVLEITDNGALSLLNLSSCKLTRGAPKPNGWAGQSLAADWGEKDEHWEMDVSGIIALADAIPDMGAMTSLNLAVNGLQAEGAKHIAGALKVSKCVLAVILAPLSCWSDQCSNCWCLLLSPGYGGTFSVVAEEEWPGHQRSRKGAW